MQLSGTTIFVACNQAGSDPFVNDLGGRPPVIPRAGSVLWPCAVFNGDSGTSTNLVADLGNLLTANMVVRAGSVVGGSVIFEQVIPAAQFNPALTYSQWQARTGAHFTFSMSPTDTNFPAGPVFIGIGVTTTNAGDIALAYSGNGKITDYGIFNPGPPTAADYTSYSKLEATALFAPAGAGGDFAPAITSVGDGAPGSLEAVPTAALAVPVLRTIYLPATDEVQDWLLVAGTTATAAGQVQRPADYDASTNAKVWVRKR